MAEDTFHGLAHGRRWTYLSGCRCEPCRAADRDYKRARAGTTKPSPPEGWGTVLEAARRLGMSESGVRGWIERGLLKSRKEGWRVFVRLPPAGPETLLDEATVSIEQAAAAMRLHPNTLRRAVRAGRLRAVQHRPVLRFDPTDLEAFVESCRVVPRG